MPNPASSPTSVPTEELGDIDDVPQAAGAGATAPKRSPTNRPRGKTPSTKASAQTAPSKTSPVDEDGIKRTIGETP
jgi:hypothetical protein